MTTGEVARGHAAMCFSLAASAPDFGELSRAAEGGGPEGASASAVVYVWKVLERVLRTSASSVGPLKAEVLRERRLQPSYMCGRGRQNGAVQIPMFLPLVQSAPYARFTWLPDSFGGTVSRGCGLIESSNEDSNPLRKRGVMSPWATA